MLATCRPRPSFAASPHVVALAAALLLPGVALGHPTGALSGRVTDPAGAGLPGATVQAGAPGGARPAVAVTGPDGTYRLRNLPAGVYRVEIRLGDLASALLEDVAVRAGAEATLDAVLTLAVRESVEVRGRRALKDLAAVGEYGGHLVGIADAATEGTVGADALARRPLARTGELVEAVPGVIISQHSGEGKANQYYLRGFNLDHGTDFFSDVAGVPVNMPTHAHGQGYADLSFLIPELVTSVQYRKGPYYADEGDFSAAGAAHVNVARALDRGFVQAEGGEDGYRRVVAGGSFGAGGGDVLLAGELFHNDGPWVHPDDFRKVAALASYGRGDARNGFRVLFMGYQGRWNSTDQVPQRAIEAGTIPRFGAIDPTDGGRTYRYSLSSEWQRSTDRAVTRANGYVMSYGVNLFNNFTYVLEDPENGDQFQQEERRIVAGGRAARHWLTSAFGREMENAAGVQFRHDAIDGLRLTRTRERRVLSTVRDDDVAQTSGAVYVQNSTRWTDWFRSVAGLRADAYRFDVASDDARNSGTADEALLSPKLALVFGPWARTEVYANVGFGFHSNDARGATITVSPVDGSPAQKVDPLVRATGAEVGVRTASARGLESSLALWGLDLDSELLFVGDAGETEASRASRRYGVEWTTLWSPVPGLSLDANVSLSHAEFRRDDPAGNEIPGALESMVAAGVAWEGPRGFFAGARLRYFGPRPLVEDGSVRSAASTLVNAVVGWQVHHHWRVTLDVVNLFGAEDSDIDYFYTSRLPGEQEAGVDDIHTHPALPRTLRLALRHSF